MYTDTTNSVEFKIIGNNLKEFLQGLITNNINNIDNGPVETFILTPQGKIKHQVTITDKGDSFNILCTNDQGDLFKFLNMYAMLKRIVVEKVNVQNVYDKKYFLRLLEKGKLDTNFLTQPSLYPAEVDDSLVDYNKGCYIGQEVVARMHYKQKNKKQILIRNKADTMYSTAKVLLEIENWIIVKVPVNV
tara:strand:- start:965 stop:1531 length:567 start_codon:yes stop_codon:yes gene_type:complete